MDMTMVLTWYICVLPTFFLQLIASEIIFAFHIKRRPLFVWRVIGAVLISAGVLYLMSYLFVLVTDPVLSALLYVTVFFMTVLIMWFCLDASFLTLLFCAIAAYSTQNLAYRMFSIVELTGLVFWMSQYMNYWAAYLPLYYATYVIVAVVIYFVFTRRMRRENAAEIHGAKILAISAASLLVTVFLSTWANMWAWQSYYLDLIVCIFSCMSCTFILCLQSGMLRTVGYRHDIDVLKTLLEQDRKQYEMSKESIRIINVKCHDLRFRLKAAMSDGRPSADELREVEEAIDIYDSRICTGCIPLDTVLTESSLFCKAHGIRLTCIADADKLSFITPTDIYSLFGNIISNAVEAAGRVDDKERRLITFYIRSVGKMLFVTSENYFVGDLHFEDGLPTTVKEDKANHGYGMQSIRMLVKKYGGDMDISVEGDLFRLKVLFPLSEKAA